VASAAPSPRCESVGDPSATEFSSCRRAFSHNRTRSVPPQS
jgi:hypothetical protein